LFSKDEILTDAFASDTSASGSRDPRGRLTAFYMTRLYVLTFRGQSRLTHEPSTT